MGSLHRQPKEPSHVTLLSGGVGGARLARGLTAVYERVTVIVNVGDDEEIYGVAVSPDVDTVVYTLANIEGPHGWGIRDDTFTVMETLAAAGIDTTFRLGDRDLANCLVRTLALAGGGSLADTTAAACERLGVTAHVLPVTNDRLRTMVGTAEAGWLTFQEYFVGRRHADTVTELRFEGAELASPAPGVLDAIADADLVVVGPSNPPLSIWPILAVPGVREAVARRHVVAVSPLIKGRALKGPAADVLKQLGYPPGSAGVVAAYDGLVDTLIVDDADAGEEPAGVEVRATDTRIATAAAAARLARWL